MRNRITPVTDAPSGQKRINAKRNQRAKFWAVERRTVRVRCSVEVEPYFRQHLHLLDSPHGDRARIDRRHLANTGFGTELDLDVHIPGAPEHAVRAEPVYEAVRHGDHYVPHLLGVDWWDADGQRIETERTEREAAGVAQ